MTEIVCAVESRDTLGECPLWCAESGLLWWIDIERARLSSFDPARRTHRIHPLPGRFCGCAALRASGGLVLALDGGLYGFDPETGRRAFLLHAEPDRPGNRYNDGRCDRLGRLWIGTMDPDAAKGATKGAGGLYRIGPDRTASLQFDGITIPNSVAFSPDSRTLYFADTPQRTIVAFDFDLDAGRLGPRRLFADASARGAAPDGSCVDAEGFLWNAEYGGGRLVRYAPDGRVDRIVDLPVRNPTCCCFGGPDLATLYVTSAAQEAPPGGIEGCVLALRPGVAGLPEARFGG